MRSDLARAKDRAWKYFSQYIRLRDQKCVTCGSIKNPQAGHFWHNVLDFDEENINQQCSFCNKYKSGNLAVYSIYLINKLGTIKFKALDIRHTKAIGGEKRSVEDYEKIIKETKDKIREIETKRLHSL